ncbi:MAG TPA: DAK2 domain-containing protein [Candidatus Fimimonas merdipullorum]|uniref:DAK2 domain-containing protein n=1 Tax=Candidatus Fimimonas merdipullorum TaxID=2840822 RepID=A0A9D1MYA4_9BACT|nr:DAK2 domain-containing protein [Candidatus Fimimonas merdipullorum]
MSSAYSNKTHITASVMKRMFIAGGKMLEVNKAQVDALNVFPVPDGDTGTNMSLTMMSAIKEINQLSSTSMAEFSDKLAKGALRGARGNSGVILSQILKGFSNVIAGCEEVDARNFAKGLREGAQLAYNAVSKPKEGTILTVVRGMAEEAMDVAKRTNSIEKLLNAVLAKGEETLAKTPDMLDVLKRAGVVDSGGFGLITLFKGIIMGYLDQEVTGAEEYALSETAKPQASDSDFPDDSEMFVDYESLGELDFGYCTEFFIINIKKRTTVTDIDKLRDYLNEIGNSVICIGDLSMVKVHVHTNNPGKALSKALTLGELDKIKIENMMEQNRQLRAKYEAERKPIGLLAVCSGEGFSAIFKDLLVDQVIEGGQTMNPSAEDIASAARKINAENIIILPNNKNIILSAEQSRTLVQRRNIFVLPTKDIPQGITAVLNYSPDAPLKENLENMTAAFSNIDAGQVTYAVRDTVIGKRSIKKGNIIGIDKGDIVTCGKSVEKVTLDLIGGMMNPDKEVVTLYYGSDVKEEDAEAFAEKVQATYPDVEVILHYGGQPLYYYVLSVE